MHPIVLVLHNSVRWVILCALVVVGWRSFVAWRKGRVWRTWDERWHVLLVAAFDTQLLLGLTLYLWLSPLPRALWADFAGGMKNRVLRFFGLEHIAMMVLAVIVVHVGRAISKRASAARRHRHVWISTLAALVIVAASIPWPGLEHARPLLRTSLAVAPPEAACPVVYREQCAACHGARGHGDGPSAAGLTPRPRDYSDPKLASRSDDELMGVIRDGGLAHQLSAAMPSHGHLSDAELEELVQCVRALGSGGR